MYKAKRLPWLRARGKNKAQASVLIGPDSSDIHFLFATVGLGLCTGPWRDEQEEWQMGHFGESGGFFVAVALPVVLIGAAALAIPFVVTPKGTRSQRRLFVSALMSALLLFGLSAGACEE